MKRKRAPLIGLCEATKRYGSDNVTFVRPQYVPDGHCCWCGQIISNKRRQTCCCKECADNFFSATSSVYYSNTGSRGGYANHILRRDNYTCQVCGAFHAIFNKHGIPLPTTDGQLEIHHKIRVCDGGTDAPDNLITVCKDCHKFIHKMQASPEVKGED